MQLHLGERKLPGHGVGMAAVNELVAGHAGEPHLSRANFLSVTRHNHAGGVGLSRIRSGCVQRWPRKITYLILKSRLKVFRAARFAAAAALATAALLACDDVSDIGNSVGAINGGSAVEDDLDEIDDADWCLLEVT